MAMPERLSDAIKNRPRRDPAEVLKAAAFALSSADCGEFGELRTELTRELGKAHKRLERNMRKSPWHERAKELLEDEGPYADYAAWHEWIYEKCPAVEDMNQKDQVDLYVSMCELVDESPANYEQKG